MRELRRGTEVRRVETGEEGVVSRQLPGGSVFVRFNDGRAGEIEESALVVIREAEARPSE